MTEFEIYLDVINQIGYEFFDYYKDIFRSRKLDFLI